MERNGTWHGNNMGYEATKAAYTTEGEEWLNELLSYLNKNNETVRGFLANKLPKIKLIEPEGTYLLWLDFRELGLSVEELKSLLVNEAKLGFNSGEIFGRDAAGFQRMNIACPSEIVEEALNRLERVFSKL